jgi:hypothetical protein
MGMPTLRKPGWAKELRRKKVDEDIPDQITIIKKGNGNGITQPLSMNGESRYTGTGPDRTLQPGKVAGDVHEGETVFSANATQAFPPDVLKALNDQAENGSLDIPALREALNLPEKPGYATGSWGKKVLDMATGIKNKTMSAIQPITTQNTTGQQVANKITTENPTTPTTTEIKPAIQPITTQNTTEQQVANKITTENSTTPTTTEIKPPTTITPIVVPNTTEPKVANKITTENPTIPTITEIKLPPTTTVTPKTETVTPTQPSAYQTAYDQSLSRIQDVAGGNSQIDRNIANRNLRLYDTGAATDIQVADQNAAMQNDIPDSARAALGAEARSSVRSGRSELIGELSQAEQERALSANESAANLAMQGMSFEEDKSRYKDTADWKEYETAIAAGDFDTAGAAYKRITGNDISMDQMKLNQTYLNKKQEQDITQGDLAITSLKTKIGDEKWNSIQSRIAGGASLSQVNAEYPGLNLTQADYKNMYDATPLGERTWERNMSYAKTLLEAGGSANITAAAGIFNQAFPGTGIDFSKLITADNAATVNQGMAQMSDLIAAGMDYDAAIDVMKKNGTLTMLGMDDATVEKVYRGMKVNAIDEQWNAIADSDWYKTQLNDDQRKDMSTFFTAVLSGELDYSIQKEYTVTAKDGTKSTMYFNNEADANAYGSTNGATMVSTGKSKVTPRTSVLDESGTSTTTTTKRTEPLGTVIVEDGKIKQVIADGATQEIVPDANDPFSDNNNLIIKAGEKDNPYYKTIFDQQYNLITGGHDIASTLNTSAVAGTNYNLDQFNKTFEEYKDLSFESPLIQKLKEDIESASNRSSTTKLTIVKDGNSWKITRT